jgi:hypothetical protein
VPEWPKGNGWPIGNGWLEESGREPGCQSGGEGMALIEKVSGRESGLAALLLGFVGICVLTPGANCSTCVLGGQTA